MTALLDHPLRRPLRHTLLQLLHSLLLAAAAMQDSNSAAVAASAENGVAFVRSGGVQLAVDLLTCATKPSTSTL